MSNELAQAVLNYLKATQPRKCTLCKRDSREAKTVKYGCLDCVGDLYYACEDHAEVGGQCGDDEPWLIPGFTERAELIHQLKELGFDYSGD